MCACSHTHMRKHTLPHPHPTPPNTHTHTLVPLSRPSCFRKEANNPRVPREKTTLQRPARLETQEGDDARQEPGKPHLLVAGVFYVLRNKDRGVVTKTEGAVTKTEGCYLGQGLLGLGTDHQCVIPELLRLLSQAMTTHAADCSDRKRSPRITAA